MVENIKSKYIIKIIFTFVNERQKLKIIKHNKKLQNIIDINITNYKFLSRRYVEYEPKGIGKEYYSNGKLKSECKYLNGERNGKGKEYNYYGKLIFEGEYLDGKRNGKGKEYDEFGKLIFEGEYLNGNRIIGKIYDIKQNLY